MLINCHDLISSHLELLMVTQAACMYVKYIQHKAIVFIFEHLCRPTPMTTPSPTLIGEYADSDMLPLVLSNYLNDDI